MSKSKENKSRLLITMKEMNLIKNSETTKDSEIYGNLFYALQKYETLSEKDLVLSSTFDKQAVIALTNEQMKSELMKKIICEWYGIDYYISPGKKIPCQICHTPNTKIHYIKNKYNKNELNVGSECIKQFPEIENFKEMQRNSYEREKSRKQELRRAEFAQLEIDDPEFVSKARKNFNNINILLPFYLYNDINQIIYNLNFVKTNYIQHGGDYSEVSSRYNKLKVEYTALWNKAIEHYQKNYKNKLVCKKNIANWLKENYLNIWENISKNNGLFTVQTLKFAYEGRFVKEHLKSFSKQLEDDEIRIIDIAGNSIRFAIQNEKYRDPVYFTISNKVFMERLGCFCIIDKDFTFNKDNLTEIKIDDYASNLDALVNRMLVPMQQAGLSLEIGEHSKQLYYKRLPRDLKKSKWSDRVERSEVGYKKIASGYYFNVCNDLLFKSDDVIKRAFESILYKLEMGSTKWISQKELHEQEQITKELTIRNQRDFINYA